MLNNSIISALQAHGIGAGKKRTGNAQPNDVRAGKIFSNKDGYDLVGNLPVRETSDITITPSDVDMTYPAGIYDGSITVKGDVNLTPANIVKGKSIFGIIGTFSSETNKPITADDVLSGKVGFVNGTKITGTMSNNGAVSHTLTNQGASYTIPKGYHNGNGVVNANITNLIAANIKAGVTVGGVLGTFTSDATATANQILNGYTAYVNGEKITGKIPSKTAATYTPGTSDQTISAGQYLSGTQTIKGDENLIAANIKNGVKIFNVTGTFTSDATATAAQILSGYTAYSNGSKITGTLSNQGAKIITPSTISQPILAGYHNGQGYVVGSPNLIPANIKNGVTIFGVTGTLDVTVDTNYGSINTGYNTSNYFEVKNLPFTPIAVYLESEDADGNRGRFTYTRLSYRYFGTLTSDFTFLPNGFRFKPSYQMYRVLWTACGYKF